MPEGHELLDDDEKHLASLGYTQELHRSWSAFSNFAISFSIISILAGCFTSFGLGWNNGGPAAIAWGWPLISVFILIIGLCMSELVSAYPTSGGIYWWAAKLGGPKAGFYTGWLNLVGLIAILASVAYGSATFLDLTLGTFSESWLAGYSLTRTFVLFIVILVVVALINIFSSHLLAVINNISVWWHVIGALAVVAILWMIPEQHASFSTVFTTTVNNTGWFGGSTSGFGFLLFVLPMSAILTQYTITGYDASAHLSEETKSAADGIKLVDAMKAIPTDDPLFGKGVIRADGRKIHPMYLLATKTPEESKDDWDYFKVVSTVKPEDAWRPIEKGGCPFLKS